MSAGAWISPGALPGATFHHPGYAWTSAHLFLRGNVYGPPGDRMVLQGVQPFVRACLEQGWIQGFFFIRYGELGPHVRLRLYGDPAVLAREVEPALEAHLADAVPAAWTAPPRTEPGAVTRASAVPSLRWIRYEPEVERYGGPDGLRVAEALFRVSSDACMGLLGNAPLADRALRLGRALPAMVVQLGTFTDDPAEAAALARLHRNSFVGHPELGAEAGYTETFDAGLAQQEDVVRDRVQSFWTAVQEGVDLPAPLDAYHAGIVATRQRLRAVVGDGRLVRDGAVITDWDEARCALLPSYGHMTCNRLGVTYREEGYLMHMIDRILGHPASAAPSA